MIPTASPDRGTGEHIPMSSPVSRGNSLCRDPSEDDVSPNDPDVLESDSGLPCISVMDCKCGGGNGAERSSLGSVSMPPTPKFSP
jgi:hypothetical protein